MGIGHRFVLSTFQHYGKLQVIMHIRILQMQKHLDRLNLDFLKSVTQSDNDIA